MTCARRPAPRPSRRRRPAPTDEGSAVVEFVFLAVLLLVPLVYLLLAVFSVQRAAYGVTAAAREAGRAYVTAAADGEGEARARRAAAAVLADHGIATADAVPEFSCDRHPCLAPGARITVRISTRVPLPFLAGVPGGRSATAVPVGAEHVETVDRYRSTR